MILNDVAPSNMKFISVTLEVSKLDKSLLNDSANVNIDRMEVTLEVSKFDKVAKARVGISDFDKS